MYVIAPNIGPYFLTQDSDTPIDAGGGQSMIVDYRGTIIGQQRSANGSGFASALVNIEALRHYRQAAQSSNWLKDVRSELAQIIYEQPVYPKNLYLERQPSKHQEYKHDVIEKQIAMMQERGIWKPPAS